MSNLGKLIKALDIRGAFKTSTFAQTEKTRSEMWFTRSSALRYSSSFEVGHSLASDKRLVKDQNTT